MQNQQPINQVNHHHLLARWWQAAVRLCLPIMSIALGVCGVAALAVCTKMQSLPQLYQFLIISFVTLYVTLTTVSTLDAWAAPPAAVLVPRVLGKMEKFLGFLLLVTIWSMTIVGGDNVLALGLGCITVHAQLVLKLHGFGIRLQNLLAPLLALVAMVLVSSPVRSSLGALLVLLISSAVVVFMG